MLIKKMNINQFTPEILIDLKKPLIVFIALFFPQKNCFVAVKGMLLKQGKGNWKIVNKAE